VRNWHSSGSFTPWLLSWKIIKRRTPREQNPPRAFTFLPLLENPLLQSFPRDAVYPAAHDDLKYAVQA
jgi:hypothetical protein